jgi:hypothetical protein
MGRYYSVNRRHILGVLSSDPAWTMRSKINLDLFDNSIIAKFDDRYKNVYTI